MKAGSWPAIVATYAFGVVGVASLAKLIPLQGEFQQIGATPAQFAWLIALLGVPAALLAALSGAVVDRVGPRVALIASAGIGIIADAGYALASSIHAFQFFRLVEGVCLVGIFSAGPALLMATTEGKRRVAAMTFWSTYTPVGFSLGIVLGSAFAGTPQWHVAFLMHGALLVAVALFGFALPAVPLLQRDGLPTVRARLASLGDAYKQGPLVRLALVFFLVISVGFGSNTVLPAWLALAHDITVPAASRLIAGTNLAMIGGAFLTAALISRGVKLRTLCVSLAVAASIAGALVFSSATSLRLIVPILCAWYVAMGAATALLLATLPRLSNPAGRGAAAGLLNQSSAIATFVTPPLWLGLLTAGSGWYFAALIAGAWLIGAALYCSLSAARLAAA